ncbi:MAG: MAPEG family protein [Rheinheimera sp.]
MSMLLLALLVVAMLPYLAKAPVAKAMHQLGGYDNHHPRAQQAKLTGLGQRATAAHYNSFEALQLFLAALLSCVIAQNYDGMMQLLAWGFVACRVVYILLYLMDKALLRSIVWVLSVACVVTMMLRAVLTVSG